MENERRQQALKTIGRFSFLKDSNQLKEWIDNFKQEEKDYITKIQTLSLDELVEETKKKLEEDYIRYVEYIERKLVGIIREEKEYARKIDKDKASHEISSMFGGITYAEIASMTEEGLYELKMSIIKKKHKQDIDSIPDRYKSLKEKYDGITEKEIDEYVDLLCQKKLLVYQIELKKAEANLKYMEKHPISNIDLNYIETRGVEYSISSIENLDSGLLKAKEKHKKSLKWYSKFASIVGGSFITLFTTAGLLNGDVLQGLIPGFAFSGAIIGLVGAIGGIKLLREVLNNKKVVEKLKSEGIYDMLIEKAGLEKEIEEFEINKGLRR